MSIIGNNLLNEIVKADKVYSPAQILDLMSKRLRQYLKQSETGNDDGMDVCLVRIDKSETSQKQKVTFAGAKRPLLVYRAADNFIESYKGNINTIGGNVFIEKYPFTEEVFELDSGDIIYLTSDGFTDQQSTDRRRLGTAAIKRHLLDNAGKTMQAQKEALAELLTAHQGEAEQRDDITVLGVRL